MSDTCMIDPRELQNLMVESDNIDTELLHDFYTTVNEAEARQSAMRDIAEELGCDPLEVMKALMEHPLV